MQISDRMIDAALRGWCGYSPGVDLSKYQQAPETKEAWRRALEAALVAMGGDASDFVKQLKDSAYWQSNEDYAKAAACIEDLASALRYLLHEWEMLTKKGSPFAKDANERVSYARATLERWGLNNADQR